MRRILLNVELIACVVVLSVSCDNKQSGPIFSELSYETICELDQTECPVGRLNSLEVMRDGSILLCTNKDVLEYSAEGKFIRRIGHSGRADGEYVMPMVVRSYEDKIFVWSAMTLQFLEYDSEGNFVASYPYESGVNDFLPSDDRIFISPTGARDEYVIDVYGRESKSVCESLTLATEEQKAMQVWSIAPIFICSGDLYYMPKDRLSIYRCGLDELFQKDSLAFVSKTFSVPKIKDAMSVLENMGKYEEYQNAASFVVGVFVGDGGAKIKVLTSEGEYSAGKDVRKAKRYYTVYNVDGGMLKGNYSFHSGAIADCALICNCGGEMYFLRNEIQEGSSEETWTLCKAKL